MFNKLKNLSKGQMVTGGIAAAGIIGDLLSDTLGLGGPNKTTQYLWKFVEHDSIYSDKKTDAGARKYGYGPAPDLVGAGQSTAPGDNGISPQHINVIDDFMWTQSPKTSRQDVPVMMLREKRIQVNPQLNQIANNLFVATEKAGRGKEMIKTMTPQELAEKISNNEVKAENELGGKLLEEGKKALDMMDQSATSSGGVLSPYDHLYYTKDTGFVYSLPYMEEVYKDVGNKFGGSGPPNALMGIAGKMAEGVALAAQSFNLADPGTYVEQPQLYDFGGRDKKAYTVNFPLINTNSFNDVIRNWQLLFLLIYQNTPNRLTRDLIDPPCIYEANLDGTWYSQYAYVERVSVKFVGATRRMKIPVPTEATSDGTGDINSNTINIDTIIPDAYQVSVTVREIFSETQNFLYTSVNSQNRLITTENRMFDLELPTAVQDIAGALGRKVKDKLGF